MAVTKFVEDLSQSIFSGNRAKVTSLLNNASSNDWTAAGTDISHTLQDLARSRLSAADKASFAKTIVAKGTVDSDVLSDTTFEFIFSNNFAAAHNVLTAAAATELKSDPRFYGDMLTELSRSNLTNTQQAELAKLIVTKTTVDSDGLANSVFEFIFSNNFTAAHNILTAAAATELKSDPRFYGDMLTELPRSDLTSAQQAELVKLIVTKTTADSDGLADSVFEFIFSGNYTAAHNVLTAAATTELKSDPRFYGDMLTEISRSNLTNAQQAELAKLIVTKTTVDSDGLANSVFEFIFSNNFTAAHNVLTAAAATELKSDPRFYGDMLTELPRSDLTNAQQAELARLIVTKTAVDSEGLANSVFEFIQTQNTGAVNTIMLNASAAEKSSFTPELHQELADFGYKSTHDVVRDTAGNDVLYGYNGNDILYGGFGRDTLSGGKGSDRFMISDKVFRDTITDFSLAEKDVLVLSKSLFNKSVADIDKAIDDFVIARTSGDHTIISVDADGRGAGKAIDVVLLQNTKGIDVDVLHNKGIIDIA